MKTYILNSLDRIREYSKRLDAKAILYNKNWEIFNDDGEKEALIFRPNNELLIVRKGIVQKTKWELLPTSSILITTDTITYLFNAAFVDSQFLALQLDGTNECMIMIDSETKKQLVLETIDSIERYLNATYTPQLSIEETSCQEVGLTEGTNSNTDKEDPSWGRVLLLITFSAILGLLLWIIFSQ